MALKKRTKKVPMQSEVTKRDQKEVMPQANLSGKT